MSTFDSKNATTVERLYMWNSGLDVFLDYPLTGVGPGNLRTVYTAYKDPEDPWLKHRRFTHLHDNLLQIAAERGAVAVILWLAIWVGFYVRAIGVYLRLGPEDGEARALVVGGLASMTGFLVMGIFEYNYGDTEVVTLSHFVMALPFVAGVSMIGRESRDGSMASGEADA
jgi:O-antigen ligase